MKTVSFKTLGFSLLVAASAVIIPTAVVNQHQSVAVAEIETLADYVDTKLGVGVDSKYGPGF